MFANIVWPPKLANIPPYYVFLIQIIDGNCIFGHSLASIPQDKKLANIPPSKVVGLPAQSSRKEATAPFKSLGEMMFCPP